MSILKQPGYYKSDIMNKVIKKPFKWDVEKGFDAIKRDTFY